VLLVKLTIDGDTIWAKAYGGANFETCWSVLETYDNNYVLAGYTWSFGSGSTDAFLIKTDSLGNMLWSKQYGGLSQENARCVVEASDGGYIMAGMTLTYGAGGSDFYVIKTDQNGDIQWSKTYGGSSNDEAYAITATQDNGYVVVGHSRTFGNGDTAKVLVIRIDSVGSLIWSKTYGGDGWDNATDVIVTSDNSIVVAATTKSFGPGQEDNYYVFKTDMNGYTMDKSIW